MFYELRWAVIVQPALLGVNLLYSRCTRESKARVWLSEGLSRKWEKGGLRGKQRVGRYL